MNPILLHTAGATVQHKSPFSDLEVPVSIEPLPIDIRENWVRPLYFGLRHDHIKTFLEEHLFAANADLVRMLLTQFDWRSRTTGAHLAALLSLREFESQIGNLLLRSDVCYAGFGYCLAIASFNTTEGVEFLRKYLRYYLNRPELFFDQNIVMGALAYLDELNGTEYIKDHMQDWHTFVDGKQGWDLEKSIENFKQSMDMLLKLKPA
ncbi:MAG: DUF6000 family protein [Pseudomonadota bacterium]